MPDWLTQAEALLEMPSIKPPKQDDWLTQADELMRAPSLSADAANTPQIPPVATRRNPHSFAAMDEAFREDRPLVDAQNAFVQGVGNVATAIPTSIGAAQEAAKGIAVPMMMSLMQGPDYSTGKHEELGGSGIDVAANPLIQAGLRGQEAVEQALPVKQEGFLRSTLPRAAGSLLAFMGGGLAAGPLAAAGLGAATEAAGQLRDAKAAGADDETTLKAAGLGGIIGTSEALPIGAFLRRANQAVGGSLKAVLKRMAVEGATQGTEEAIQEVGQQIASNATARALYDEQREILDGVAEGGAAGGLLGLLVGSIGGRIRDYRHGIAEQITQSLNVAQRIAAKDVPSRSDFKGLVRADQPLNQGDRAAIADEVRAKQKAVETVEINSDRPPTFQPIPVVPASEQGPLTLATEDNQSRFQGDEAIKYSAARAAKATTHKEPFSGGQTTEEMASEIATQASKLTNLSDFSVYKDTETGKFFATNGPMEWSQYELAHVYRDGATVDVGPRKVESRTVQPPSRPQLPSQPSEFDWNELADPSDKIGFGQRKKYWENEFDSDRPVSDEIRKHYGITGYSKSYHIGKEGARKQQADVDAMIQKRIERWPTLKTGEFLDEFFNLIDKKPWFPDSGLEQIIRALPESHKRAILDRRQLELLPHRDAQVRRIMDRIFKEKPNEEVVQRQGQVESESQGQAQETAQGADVLAPGPTATAEPVPANTGQPVVEKPTPKGLYSQAAVERRLDAATREHGEMITGDEFAAPQDPDAEGGEHGSAVQSGWTFRDTPQGRAAAKDLRDQLPAEWKHLANKITTGPNGKGEDIRHNIGEQAMLDGMIQWHKRNSPKASRTTTAEYIDKNQNMFSPQDVYAAKQFLGLLGAGKGEKPKMYKNPQIIDADMLSVGDKVEVAETPFTVKGIDPDTGVASLEDHGENLEVAQGGKLAIDPGSLKQKTRSADFTAPTGPTGLFNQETFETQTGSQQTMAFGTENTIGQSPTPSGSEAKIRKQYDPGATKPLFGAEKARKEFGDALDEFGKYLEGRQFTGAIFDPEIYKLAAKVVGKGVVAGYRTFNEFVRDVAAKVGTDRARRLMPALRDEWTKAKATTPDLDDPSDVDFSGVIEPAKPQIRPDLSNPAEGTAAQGLVESVDAARNLAGTPDVRADVDVRTAAEAMLRNPEAVRKTVLDRSQNGKDLSDVETAAAKRLLVQEATKAVLSGDEKAITDAMTLGNAYRQTGTEQGRAFRQRQNLGETDEEFRLRSITEAVLTPPEGVADVEWAKQAAVVREYLKERGFDLALIETLVKNPVTTAQVLGEIHAFKSPRSDKAFEYWRNAILSAPTTQAANIIGNTGNAAWDMTAQRFVEATINTLGKRPGDASFGEFPYLLRGALPGISRGAQNFLAAWRSEVPTFDMQMGRLPSTQLETPNIHIKGKLGKFIRIPQRGLLAFDEFAKSMIWEMQVAAHAYRIAKSEKLTGKAMADRIQELAMDTGSKAADAAYNDALRLTFQDHTGKVLQYALAARKDIPGLRYLMPFVTTPVNIMRTGLSKSPLGALPLANKIIKAVQTGNYDGITPRIAEQVIAWAVMAALLGSNDPDDPWITGAAAELDKRTSEFAQRQGTPPSQSIRIGDTWVSYARIEPAATALSIMVDMTDAWKKQGIGGAVSRSLESVLGQLDTKTFLRGVGDLMNAVRERSLESVAQWASNFTTSWVPNIVRAGSRATKENVSERSTWARGEEWRERFGKRLIQKTELGIIADQPRYDVWGRPIKYGTSPVPGTDWLYRMLSPLNVKMVEPFVGDVAILNWNNANPDDEWFPAMPQKYFTKGGKQTYMSDEKFAAYSKDYGERARKKVENYYTKPPQFGRKKPDPFNPTKHDMEVIQKLRTDAGKEARNAVK